VLIFNIKHPIHKIISSLIVAILIYLFVVPLFRYLILDKNSISRETASFNLADSFQLQGEEFTSGFCSDNCPSTQLTYSVKSSPNSKILNDLEATFAKNGYKRLSKGDNSVGGTKNNGRYRVEAFTLKESTGYEEVKTNVL
jgi:hypothetical protein